MSNCTTILLINAVAFRRLRVLEPLYCDDANASSDPRVAFFFPVIRSNLSITESGPVLFQCALNNAK